MKQPKVINEVICTYFSRRFDMSCANVRKLPDAFVIRKLLYCVNCDIAGYASLNDDTPLLCDQLGLCEIKKLNPALVDEWEYVFKYSVSAGFVRIDEIWTIVGGHCFTQEDVEWDRIVDACRDPDKALPVLEELANDTVKALDEIEALVKDAIRVLDELKDEVAKVLNIAPR